MNPRPVFSLPPLLPVSFPSDELPIAVGLRHGMGGGKYFSLKKNIPRPPGALTLARIGSITYASHVAVAIANKGDPNV